MAYKYLKTERAGHIAQLMEMSANPDLTFTAICPTCGYSTPLAIREAASGQVRCFGNVVLMSWSEEPKRT